MWKRASEGEDWGYSEDRKCMVVRLCLMSLVIGQWSLVISHWGRDVETGCWLLIWLTAK